MVKTRRGGFHSNSLVEKAYTASRKIGVRVPSGQQNQTPLFMEEMIPFQRKESQCKRIIAYIKEHGSITSRQAVRELDIMSPRKRLSEISRTMPLTVKVVRNVYVDEQGRRQTIRYNQYSL